MTKLFKSIKSKFVYFIIISMCAILNACGGGDTPSSNNSNISNISTLSAPYSSTNDLEGFTIVGYTGEVNSLSMSGKLTNTTPAAGAAKAIASDGNGKFVTVGDAGTIMTSTDGNTWKAAADISGTINNLLGVTYGDGKFVAVGEAGMIMSSTDGINWTSEDSHTPYMLIGITYKNGLFVAVGNYGTVLTSTDAINWTLQPVMNGINLSGVI